MKKSLVAILIAAPVLSLSSMAFAAEPVQLSAEQMDVVTAGYVDNFAAVSQYNNSPVTVAQVNTYNFGYASNDSYVDSYNYSYIDQYTY